jgi:hypothetical protein
VKRFAGILMGLGYLVWAACSSGGGDPGPVSRADSGEERTGCDYLLPYWLGRYYGYIGEDW